MSPPMNRQLIPILAGVFAMTFAVTSRAASHLSSAKPGDIVQLPEAPALAEIPSVDAPVTPAGGPPLLFSDGPEYFPGNGIAFREDVKPGRFRLYIYHCPESSGAKKTVTSVIENLGDAPMKLRFGRYGYEKPGKDYL